MNVEFLDYLLKSGLNIHLYVEDYCIYPNTNGKWNVGPDQIGWGILYKAYKEDLTSKEIFEIVEKLKNNQSLLDLAKMMKK